MDPVSLTTGIITIAGAVCKSYEQISNIVTLVRSAAKQLEGICSRAGSINDLVSNLKQALGEGEIRRVIERDELALHHVQALDAPLKAVERTLDEVLDKLRQQYQPTSDEQRYKIRWRYIFSTSNWQELQTRLDAHVQVLSVSMQGLNTLSVLRILGTPGKDPAKTLRTYATSILETQSDDNRTLAPSKKLSSLHGSDTDQPGLIPLDDRRRLAKKKARLQKELLHAARNGDYYDVSLLLGEGVGTEWSDENEGMTALHHAARHGHYRVAELLIKAGADIEARSDALGNEWTVKTAKGRTPLIWAAAGQDSPRLQERMCTFLLDKGADVNARNDFARTALQEAAMSARYEGVAPYSTIELLLRRGAFVNAHDKNGWTALTEAAFYGQLELAKLLIAHGANLEGRPRQPDDPAHDSNPDFDHSACETPLVACSHGTRNMDLIRLLLEKGAKPQGVNLDAQTSQVIRQHVARRHREAREAFQAGRISEGEYANQMRDFYYEFE